MNRTLFLKILFATIVFLIGQRTTQLKAQNLFGFKYIFRIYKYNQLYGSAPNGAYRNSNGLVNLTGFELLKTAAVKRGTTIVPSFSMGTSTSGTFTANFTKSVENRHPNANTLLIITSNGVVTTQKTIVATFLAANGRPSPYGVSGTPLNGNYILNNGVLETTFATNIIPNPAGLITLPAQLSGNFITNTNAISTNGILTIAGNNIPFTIISANHGTFTNPITNEHFGYTGMNAPNNVTPNGRMITGNFVDTNVVNLGTDTIFYSGNFTQAITDYSSDVSAASHYDNELSFHPYVYRLNGTNHNAAEFMNMPPAPPAPRAPRAEEAFILPANLPNYDMVFTMSYINQPNAFRLQYSSIPYFDLRFRSGYVGAITIPLSFTFGPNSGWSTTTTTFLNGGFSIGKVWGHTTFYEDENITPVNWYQGVGIFSTFSTGSINLTPHEGTNTSDSSLTTYNVVAMVGFNYIFHFYGVDFIIAAGDQWAIGKNSSYWATQGSLWAGAGIGFNVLKLTAPNGGW